MAAARERPCVFRCGDDEMLGILHEPGASGPAAGILIVVGGPQYRVGSHRQFTLMARAFAAAGFAVLRADYRGMGDSGGEARSFEDVGDDLGAAVDAFRAEVPGLGPIYLWGLCDGASSALMFANGLPRIQGLMLANPWVRTTTGEARAYVRHYYRGRLLQRDFWQKLLRGRLNVLLAVSEFVTHLRHSRQGRGVPADDGASFIGRMQDEAARFPGPILVLLSGRDLTAREFERLHNESVSWQQALTGQRVSWVRLPDADHTFSDRFALERACQESVQWLRRMAEEAR
jgi:uncharacterized protein